MNFVENKIFFYRQDTVKFKKPELDTSSFVQKVRYQTVKKNELNFTSNSKVKNEKLNNTLSDSIINNNEISKIQVNNKSLLSNYIDSIWFNSVQDSNCYIVKNQVNIEKRRDVFLTKINTQNHIEKPLIIKEKHINTSNWTILPLILGMILLVFILTIYRKYLALIIENVTYQITKSKTFTDKNVHFQRFAFILDLIFIISLSLIADRIIQLFGIYSPPEKYQYLIFVIFCAFLIALRLFRGLTFKIIEIFTNKNKFFHDLINSSTLYTRTLGILLLPMVFLISYSTGFIASLFIYLSIFIVMIMLIMRIISMLKVFILSGLSIFYFILYLCALEIAPLLVIWKEVAFR